MWCDEIIRLFNNKFTLSLSIQRAEFFHELFSSTFRFEMNHDIDEDGSSDDGEYSLTITKLDGDGGNGIEIEIDQFIYWFHTMFYRELVNELETLNNGNNDYEDIVYRVESLEQVIESFK